MVRRGVLCAMLIGCAWASGVEAGQGHSQQAEVSVRFYDYARMQPELAARAQAYVSSVFDGIGVSVRWEERMQMANGPAPSRPVDRNELIVIVLNDEMARRKDVPKGVLGTAATGQPEHGNGPARIAYVLFDRVKDAAVLSGQAVGNVMGLVTAHELGHLLLPWGSHSESGVMRGAWGYRDLGVRRRPFRFTATQADGIRELLTPGWRRSPPAMVQGGSLSFARPAGEAGTAFPAFGEPNP